MKLLTVFGSLLLLVRASGLHTEDPSIEELELVNLGDHDEKQSRQNLLGLNSIRDMSTFLVREQSRRVEHPEMTCQFVCTESLKAIGALSSILVIMVLAQEFQHLCQIDVAIPLIYSIFGIGIFEALIGILGMCTRFTGRKYNTGEQCHLMTLDFLGTLSVGAGVVKALTPLMYYASGHSICSMNNPSDVMESRLAIQTWIPSIIQMLLIIMSLGLAKFHDVS